MKKIRLSQFCTNSYLLIFSGEALYLFKYLKVIFSRGLKKSETCTDTKVQIIKLKIVL